MDTQKTAPQTRQDDKVRWQLDGIAAERQHIQARLQYLDQQEQELRGQAMTGTPTTAPAKRSGKRTRKLSEAQRLRQSEAAKARWARQREAKAKEAMASVEAQTTAIPPRVETADQVTA